MPIQQILLGGSGFPPLTASAAPALVVGSSPNPTVVTSTYTTATASGGTGSYTYQWEHVSGPALEFVNPPNSAQQAWRAYVPNNTQYTAFYRCKVSDGVSTVYTNNVEVSLSVLGIGV